MKKDVREVIQGEEPHLNNLLTQEDLSSFKGMVDELRDTWTKKQMFRTETEARFSVLQDNRYPTKAAKYWQCVREQSSYLDNLMALSFDYSRNEAKIKWLEDKTINEENEFQFINFSFTSSFVISNIESDKSDFYNLRKALTLPALCSILVLLEPDFGTTLTISGIILMQLLFSEIKLRYPLLILALSPIPTYVAINIMGYRTIYSPI